MVSSRLTQKFSNEIVGDTNFHIIYRRVHQTDVWPEVKIQASQKL